MLILLRIILALFYGIAVFAAGYLAIIALVILAGGVHGAYSSWLFYLVLPLALLSLVIVFRAFRGWGMPARLMPPPPPDRDDGRDN